MGRGGVAKPWRVTIVHSSGQGALIKTHCLYSLQEASSRPRCSPDVHPPPPPPPRPSQLHSQGFSLRPTSFQVLRNHPTAFLSLHRRLFLRAIPRFLAKTFLVKEGGSCRDRVRRLFGEETSCDSLSRKRCNFEIMECIP